MSKKKAVMGDVLTPKITISAKNLRWIAKALATDPARKALMFGQVRFDHGRCWICGTDTHRLHVARCATQGDVATEPFLINVKRSLMELSYYGGTGIEIDTLSQQASVRKNGAVLGPAMGVLDQVPDSSYPDIACVVPKEKPKGVAPIFSVNQKYWRDATERAVEHANRIVWWTPAPSRPVLISHILEWNPLASDVEWFALLMPMATNGSAETGEPVEVRTLEEFWGVSAPEAA